MFFLSYTCQDGIFSVDSASTSVYIYNLNTYVRLSDVSLSKYSRYFYSVGTTFMVSYNDAGTVNQASNANGFSETVGLWKSS